jgi:acyl carrier protein
VSVSEAALLADLIGILKGMTDWEYSGPITLETRFFADLGLESIDAVVFGEAIETHYRRRLPYAAFLAGLGERGQRDLRIGELVDFLRSHLDGAVRQGDLEGVK